VGVLIDIRKKVKSNIIYLNDYHKKGSDFDALFFDELTKINKEIAIHAKEVDGIEKEIAEYEAEAEKASKELKTMLYSAGDDYGKDQLL